MNLTNVNLLFASESKVTRSGVSRWQVDWCQFPRMGCLFGGSRTPGSLEKSYPLEDRHRDSSVQYLEKTRVRSRCYHLLRHHLASHPGTALHLDHRSEEHTSEL